MVHDVLILGQGLAGTTLAWKLLRAGCRVLVLDRGKPGTSSQIAAGLITPITGQRLAKSWRLDELWPAAHEYYQSLERELQQSFFQLKRMVRIFQHDEERRLFAERADNTFAGWVADPAPGLNPEWFHAPLGAFEMPRAGQLNTSQYLNASREAFAARNAYRTVDLRVAEELDLSGEAIRVPSLGIEAKRIVFCEGAEAVQNEWFRFVRFQPAKGEILTVRIPGLQEQRIIHHGVWLVPLGGEFFRVGSTFHRDQLDSETTAAGRDEILEKLRAFVRLPAEVIAQEAAVRPVIDAGRPLLGTHPDDDRLGFFNGLGAKGALLAPLFAHQLADHLTGQGRIDPAVRLGLPVVHPAIGPRLTEQAQQAVQGVLPPGGIAIDATTGNGRDTRFLAETVGPRGTVYGFDLQADALARTEVQLAAIGHHQVRLLNRDHAEMADCVAVEHHGQVSAIMFNLGYLPGGDKDIVTRPERSIPAMEAALRLLRPGGICTIVAYVGHPGGWEEFHAIRDALRATSPVEYDVQEPPDRGPLLAPRLFLIRKRTSVGSGHS